MVPRPPASRIAEALYMIIGACLLKRVLVGLGPVLPRGPVTLYDAVHVPQPIT